MPATADDCHHLASLDLKRQGLGRFAEAAQLLTCQYLYFCTSKGSKLSTSRLQTRASFWCMRP
jgi:hypothetical protein